MNVNVRDDTEALHEIRKACELAKRKLSTMPQAAVNVFLSRVMKGYKKDISRALFEELCTPTFNKAIDILPSVLKLARVRHLQIKVH